MLIRADYKRKINNSDWVNERISEVFDDATEMLTEDAIIFGGAVRDTLAGQKLAGDLDIVTNIYEYKEVIRRFQKNVKWILYNKRLQRNPSEFKPFTPDYKKTLRLSNMTSFVHMNGCVAQVIAMNSKDIYNICRDVDIVCCGVAMSSDGQVFELVEGAHEDCIAKVLRLNKTRKNVNMSETPDRITKLILRGWKSLITKKQLDRMIERHKSIDKHIKSINIKQKNQQKPGMHPNYGRIARAQDNCDDFSVTIKPYKLGDSEPQFTGITYDPATFSGNMDANHPTSIKTTLEEMPDTAPEEVEEVPNTAHKAVPNGDDYITTILNSAYNVIPPAANNNGKMSSGGLVTSYGDGHDDGPEMVGPSDAMIAISTHGSKSKTHSGSKDKFIAKWHEEKQKWYVEGNPYYSDPHNDDIYAESGVIQNPEAVQVMEPVKLNDLDNLDECFNITVSPPIHKYTKISDEGEEVLSKSQEPPIVHSYEEYLEMKDNEKHAIRTVTNGNMGTVAISGDIDTASVRISDEVYEPTNFDFINNPHINKNLDVSKQHKDNDLVEFSKKFYNQYVKTYPKIRGASGRKAKLRNERY